MSWEDTLVFDPHWIRTIQHSLTHHELGRYIDISPTLDQDHTAQSSTIISLCSIPAPTCQNFVQLAVTATANVKSDSLVHEQSGDA